MVFLYIALTLIITAMGTISGMGGGVVLKPVMDLIGEYDAATIGVICSVTVFSMALVSLIRNIIRKTEVDFLKASALGLGAVGGGFVGQILLDLIVSSSGDKIVKLCQNIVLGVLILIVLIYTLIKNPKRFHLKNIFIFLATGVFLGIVSSFLGIGGGPINVALLMLLFGMNIKKAAVYSLITILFSQVSKLLTVTFTTGFGGFDLSILPYMVIAAVVGSIAGMLINKKLNDKAVVILFNVMQMLVLCVVVFNIISFAVSA